MDATESHVVLSQDSVDGRLEPGRVTELESEAGRRMVGGEVLTQGLDTRRGHVQRALESMRKLKKDTAQMWSQQGTTWPVFLRPFLDAPLIDVRALGVS